MTAVALFDALALRAGVPADESRSGGLISLAERLIEQSLSDLARVREYEVQFGSPELTSPSAIDVLTSVYRLYEQWAREAEQVRSRLEALRQTGHSVPASDSLEDAYGRVRARLEVTPEKMSRALEQVRQGEIVSGQGLRDELRTRLHR
jgi:hypothetical protein